LYLIISQSN